MMADETNTADVDDPVDYLSKTSEFHDCILTVGDPSTDEVEKIPVVRLQLVAHSSVFRDLLKDSDLADPTGSKTHIKDVHPEIFKLMLRHMYGGRSKELKTLTKERLLELALCADKYNVRRLVEKTCKHLIPEDVNSVFIPLQLVVYAQTPPILVQPVVELTQKETDKIVQHKEFLSIDANCVEFIAKQEKLSIEEVYLWRAIVKWGKSQAEKHDLTLVDLLKKPLAYIRFATFNVEEIIKEVLPEELFSPAEALQLLTFVSNKQVIDIPGLSQSQEVRYVPVPFVPLDWDVDKCNHLQTWLPDRGSLSISSSSNSSFTITNVSCVAIAFVSLDFKACESMDTYYSYQCEVSIVKSNNGHYQDCVTINASGPVVYGEIVGMPLKSSSGKYCILKPSESCKVVMKFSNSHPGLYKQNGYSRSDGCITVRFTQGLLHAYSIKYKKEIS